MKLADSILRLNPVCAGLRPQSGIGHHCCPSRYKSNVRRFNLAELNAKGTEPVMMETLTDLALVKKLLAALAQFNGGVAKGKAGMRRISGCTARFERWCGLFRRGTA